MNGWCLGVITVCFCYLSFVSPNTRRLSFKTDSLTQRAGAIAWALVIFVRGAISIIYSFPLTGCGSQLYSLAGALFLLIEGQYFFFFFPEWYIYGGIGMGVAVLALVNILAFSNVSGCLSAGILGLTRTLTFPGPQ